jgi:hypothetical protein
MSNDHKINWLMAVVFIAWVGMVVFLVLSNVRQAPNDLECANYDKAIYYNTNENRIVEFNCSGGGW